MSVTVQNIMLTESAQRAEILAGRDGRACRSLEVSADDPAYADLVALGQIDRTGNVTAENPDRKWDHLPTASEIRDAIREQRAAEAATALARAEEIRQATLAVLRERKTVTMDWWDNQAKCYVGALRPDWPYNADADVVSSPESQEWIADLDAQNARAIDEARDHHDEQIAAEEAEKAAERAQREEYVAAAAALIREIGTPDQIGRLDDDLLPADEQDQAIRDYLFRPLRERPRYEKLTAEDVTHDDDECSGEVEFSAEDANELPVEPWQVLREIRAAFPEATCTPRIHTAGCESCGEMVVRHSVRVAITWHGREFSREYAAD